VIVAPKIDLDNVVALVEAELGYLDSVFGRGTWDRMSEGVFKWAGDKIRSSPECVERFVCETYRTGENLEGVGYVLLKIAK
jgi:hypothetical protein